MNYNRITELAMNHNISINMALELEEVRRMITYKAATTSQSIGQVAEDILIYCGVKEGLTYEEKAISYGREAKEWPTMKADTTFESLRCETQQRINRCLSY